MTPYFPRRGTYETVYDLPGGTTVSKPHKKFVSRFKAHVVCATCNSGWMNRRVESAQYGPLKQMIDRTRPEGAPRIRVSLQDQRGLATWATKVALLYPYTSDAPGASNPRQLRAFRRDIRPPRGTYVWIGAYSMAERFLWHSQTNVTTTGPLPEGTNRRQVLTLTTFVLGHVVFRLVQGPYRSPYLPPRTDPRSGPWVRIWPASHRALIWPTPVMDLDSIKIFARSIPTQA